MSPVTNELEIWLANSSGTCSFPLTRRNSNGFFAVRYVSTARNLGALGDKFVRCVGQGGIVRPIIYEASPEQGVV